MAPNYSCVLQIFSLEAADKGETMENADPWIEYSQTDRSIRLLDPSSDRVSLEELPLAFDQYLALG